VHFGSKQLGDPTTFGFCEGVKEHVFVAHTMMQDVQVNKQVFFPDDIIAKWHHSCGKSSNHVEKATTNNIK
jgi:hypothetical protein